MIKARRRRKYKRKHNRRNKSSRKNKSNKCDENETESSEDRVKSKKTKDSSSKSRHGSKRRESDDSDPSHSRESYDSGADAKSKQKAAEILENEVKNEVLELNELMESRMKPTVDDEPILGPMQLPRTDEHPVNYGGALRPGEGDDIAQYVQQGKRIPRSGEVGLSDNEISKFESLDYVMSGSRHQRMNSMRIRNKNQVYNTEDKRAFALFNYEEKAKREQVMAALQQLVDCHMGPDVGPSHDPFTGRSSDVADDLSYV